MDKQSRFYYIWLILGLFQIIAIQGCTNSVAGNQLLSEATSESNVRLSRAFFERSLAGKMQIVAADGSSPSEIESKVSWNETLPALRGAGSIAPDHLGCALYERFGVKLCFQIMSDVTSVGVNKDDILVTGLSQATSATEIDCTGPLENIRFAHASKTSEEQVEISFIGDRPAQEGCAAGPVLIKLSLRQI